MNFIFRKIGFTTSSSGVLFTSNGFAKFIAELCVRAGAMRKLCNNVYSKNIR